MLLKSNTHKQKVLQVLLWMCGPTFVGALYFALPQKACCTSLSGKRIILLIFHQFFLHNNPYNQWWWCEVTNIRNELCKKWALIFKALPTDHKIKIMGKKLELTCECWLVCFKAKSLGAKPSFQWRQLIPTWFNTPMLVWKKGSSLPLCKNNKRMEKRTASFGMWPYAFFLGSTLLPVLSQKV